MVRVLPIVIIPFLGKYTFGSNCNVKIGDDDVIKTLTLHQFPLLSIIPLLSLRA